MSAMSGTQRNGLTIALCVGDTYEAAVFIRGIATDGA